MTPMKQRPASTRSGHGTAISFGRMSSCLFPLKDFFLPSNGIVFRPGCSGTMTRRHIIAFDAGGTAVKAALYDERGRECAVASAALAPLHPAPGRLERDPEVMWAALCGAARKVLDASGVAPSFIAAVGLTGYGDGLHLVDRNGEPVRNAILSPDQRAHGEVASWREQGLEARVVALTWHKLWAGKPLPLIAWLEKHEPHTLARAAHALMCKDYIRFRLTGELAVEISDLSSGG